MFDFGKKTFLGIDIGSSSIKMVELKMSGGKPYLSNYAWIGTGGLLEGNETSSSNSGKLTSECIKRIFKEGKFKSKEANISIPAFGGLITLIEFPEISEEELEQAIRFEAHKYIPTSLDEVVFSWDIINKKEEKKSSIKKDLMKIGLGEKDAEAKKEENAVLPKEEKLQVLLVAAPKNKIAKYESIIKEAGLDLKSVEIESFSLVRSLVGNDQGNFIILDIGLRVCNIILVEKGIIKVNRNIDAGGRDITKIVARSMGVDEKKAERMKAEGADFFSQDSNIAFPSLNVIATEVKRVSEAFYSKNSQAKIDAIILSGGTANLKGLNNYFSKVLNIKTIVGNPFSRLSYDQKLENIIKKTGTRFSVAIGLALRGEGGE